MKIKHCALLVFSAVGFCASCGGGSINADQKFLNDVNNELEPYIDVIRTCSDAVNIAKDVGYDLESYKFENNDYCFAFDTLCNQFVVMNGDEIVYSPKDYKKNDDTYAYFKFTNAYDASLVYSQYLTKDFAGADMLVVTTGLDMGSNWNVKNIIYNNTSGIAKNIVLNTFSDYLTITAPTDNIIHYGDANNVFVTSMGEDKAFHACGTYAYIQPSAGNVYLEADSSTDLFELPVGSTAKVNTAVDATITAAINAPTVPTEMDLNYVEVSDYSQITNDKTKENKIAFFRLVSDVAFPTNESNAWIVKNNFFLDLNGRKISFTANGSNKYLRDGVNYYPGILLDAKEQKKDLECYIVDTQPTLYQRPSIELNDCSIIIAGSDEHSARLNITSGRIHDIRGVVASGVEYNRAAILVMGNTEDNPNRKAYDSSFYMYGGYIRNSEGIYFTSDPVNASFKCIQPRGEGALVDMSYGDLYSLCYCISGQGDSNHDFNKFGGTIVNISGGTIVGGLGEYEGNIYTPLFFPQHGELNITGGNITGPTCLDAKCGNIKIEGGSFTATRDFVSSVILDNDEGGSIADGSVLLLESNLPYAGGPINVVIDNATMTSKNGFITRVVGKGKKDYGFKNISVTHNGGTYYYAQNEGVNVDPAITPASLTKVEVNGGDWHQSNQ
ncbi:MAG: hypothetical protein MJ214_05250 [Bacilli bacterium]|nr:hypothetical protein [Bacilli bacterium]